MRSGWASGETDVDVQNKAMMEYQTERALFPYIRSVTLYNYLQQMASIDTKLAIAKRCSHEGVVAGAKAAAMATIATAIPTIASARMVPWARAHLNHTAQALIISTVAGAAYFIVADKTILKTARKNSFNDTKKY
ncbi:hypothetical protein SSX86_026161 [Deinandra increscens subsp. villosa]|uniref:Early nodulin-93 n=1 Tax=Deinandra increscens subsp. villosa TaxID=3103831 RepID=A0AAP0GMU8_9ASTR